ncbi:unnamed protein product, partial [marine sediment metagenome]
YQETGDLISVPIDLSDTTDTVLNFFHWRESEQGWDYSYVYISIDGINWDLLYYTDANILPWEKVSLDISKYAGNSSVQLRFFFDTTDSVNNYFRGWLVDDIEILGTGSYDHELSVSLEVPTDPEIDQTYIIDATVINTGENDIGVVNTRIFWNLQFYSQFMIIIHECTVYISRSSLGNL